MRKKNQSEGTLVKTNLRRNNLDRSGSPYLRQHKDNPVWWQEWGSDVLREAVRQSKPLFVSIGYSTCHWCHVMAGEAFSDPATAEFLNQNFICIKVDRETRPDIDQYLMHFIQAQGNSGGWPLNVFLTPDQRPLFALTYAPAIPARGMQPLLVIAAKVLEYLNAHSEAIQPFQYSVDMPKAARPETLLEELLAGHDPVYGGFGMGQKFPPHSTLLYMLYHLCVEKHPELEKACRLTLDAMRRSGLHDHLQGGLFRYCVDRQWTIPHFEKMLYDQAMALWVYALAFRVLGDEPYKEMAAGLVRCLEETFGLDNLFATALDADTNHHEGATYVWRIAEIKAILSDDEFAAFAASYRLPEKGNFEGAIHLARIDDRPLKSIEEKLLAQRRQRPQPERDEKILCGVNALVACALVQAGRWLGRPELEAKGARTVKKLLEVFWHGSHLGHSLANGAVQKQSFLSDAAALLLAVTMLREGEEAWADTVNALAAYTESFKEHGRWIESSLVDFKPIAASAFDHPMPSALSLAAMGLARAAVLNGAAGDPLEYLRPLQSDFFNVAAMVSQGLFHQVHSKAPIAWERLPANAIQVRGEPESDCYQGQCRPLDI
jgi:uncharacterized protein YyaL (SSP411 family)